MMFKSLVALAIAGAMSAPALAQTAPAQQPTPVAKPQTVKKVVCQRVDVEEDTGSRLGSAPKVCKTIEVPAPAGGAASGQQAPSAGNPERGNSQ
jgi:hypothetical protein